MRYAVDINDDKSEATIIVEDGGIASVHADRDYMSTVLYQEKIDFFDDGILDRLSEGKTYIKPWRKKSEVDFEIIEHALDWLCPFCENFDEVEFNNLASEISHNKNKKMYE